MGIFGRLFGSKTPTSGQSLADAQVPQVEAVLGKCIVDFHERTNLNYILIFPIMHKMAVKVFVEDFGVENTLKHYQHLVEVLTSDGTIRESQFKSFGWPEVPPQDAPHVNELDALLWKLARELIGRGILKEAIANALVSVAMKAASKGLNPLVPAGSLITTLKELRAGVYTPPPEVRPEVPEGTDEATTATFNHFRDASFLFKEHSGLEWQHLLPGMQRVCVIYWIKERGKDQALELFREQVRRLQPRLDECSKNPPQQLPLTPLHITNMAKFNEAFLSLADSLAEAPEVRPVLIAYALWMLIFKIAGTHYDLIFLSAIFASSCTEIEQGKYDFVKKTLTATEVDQDESRSRAADEKLKRETTSEHQSGQNTETRGATPRASAADVPPHDRKYLELARNFAIVIIPPKEDNPVHAVWLMNLDEKGEIDFGPEPFVLAHTGTRDAALNYAMKLANLLKLRVLEIANT